MFIILRSFWFNLVVPLPFKIWYMYLHFSSVLVCFIILSNISLCCNFLVEILLWELYYINDFSSEKSQNISKFLFKKLESTFMHIDLLQSVVKTLKYGGAYGLFFFTHKHEMNWFILGNCYTSCTKSFCIHVVM